MNTSSSKARMVMAIRRTPSVLRLQQLLQSLRYIQHVAFYHSLDPRKLAGLRELFIPYVASGVVIARSRTGTVILEHVPSDETRSAGFGTPDVPYPRGSGGSGQFPHYRLRVRTASDISVVRPGNTTIMSVPVGYDRCTRRRSP